jgi:hypothetical protein
MKESEAWLMLAELAETQAKEIGFVFLCDVITHQLFVDDEHLKDTMKARISHHLFGKDVAYTHREADNGSGCLVHDTPNDEANAARVLACLWLAEEAKDEGN